MTAEDGDMRAKAKRQRRLEEQLRENLKRRKEQARARRMFSSSAGGAAGADAQEPERDEPGRHDD